MSTYVYLECLDHDPPLKSFNEVAQHLCELPRIRADIAHRDLYVANAASGLDISYPDYFTAGTAAFLALHPKCRIGIRDEYDKQYPIEEEVT